MTRKQLLPLALLLLVASGHGQDTAWPAAMVEKVLERFPGADVDGDGKLSPNEQNALSQKALKKHPQADRDGDAVLSRPEQQALLRKVMLPVPKANAPPVTPPPTSAPILPLATDLRAHGLAQEQIDSLAEKIRQIVSREFIAGCSFLVAHKGEIVFRQAFGYADIESKRPFTIDELLPIASVSKPVAASVIMALVEQEKLKLDAPVAQYLPDFQGMKPFTLRHLLAHTAGFWGNKNISPEKVNLIRNFERSLSESVADIATYDLLSEPGQKFQYSGAGYCVAGRVAEVALGQSFEQIAQEVLFRPLGLPRTTFLPPQETRRTIPTAYQRKAGQLRTQPSLGNVDELRLFSRAARCLRPWTNWRSSGRCT
jgi:CubicO group peptidase (beta-lactamase class C family)